MDLAADVPSLVFEASKREGFGFGLAVACPIVGVVAVGKEEKKEKVVVDSFAPMCFAEVGVASPMTGVVGVGVGVFGPSYLGEVFLFPMFVGRVVVVATLLSLSLLSSDRLELFFSFFLFFGYLLGILKEKYGLFCYFFEKGPFF